MWAGDEGFALLAERNMRWPSATRSSRRGLPGGKAKTLASHSNLYLTKYKRPVKVDLFYLAGASGRASQLFKGI
jgi:hypothetical protein